MLIRFTQNVRIHKTVYKICCKLKTMFSFRTVFIVSLLVIGTTKGYSMGNQLATHPQEHSTCNKVLCASIVSYCLIQEKCNCHPARNCSCCAECAMCLGDHYRHCCDCVGMRKGSNYSAILPTVTSTVAVLNEPSPELFRALTERPMPSLRYTILQFPVMEELALHHHAYKDSQEHSHWKTMPKNTEQQDLDDAYLNEVQVVLHRNYDIDLADSRALCTVAYFDQCVPLTECVMSCEAMGSSSYRWFHNGCCECAGPTCLNYGNMYPKCKDCML